MKLNNRHRATILVFGVIFLICASIGVGSSAQTREGVITEGESLDSINIGKSTMDDVIAFYGADYKLIKHREYSYEMVYKNLGLSFYSCRNDPNKEIFTIDIQAPFKATTAKGIILGESTFEDISRVYGKWEKNSMGFEYEKEGLYFNYEEKNKDNSEVEAKKTEVKDNSIADGAGKNSNSALTEFVIDGQAVSNLRTNESNPSKNSNDEDDDEEETAKAESEKDKVTKAKIVRQITLVEKTGLRQCETKFPQK